ncbi:hypothetical protein VNO80_27015 [Phaseolus coccineus]|uniref:Uncharacterized protein n=1 Tax=Phaseolus coccineus TaxID=3886 RepID=A0AAN9QL03_PHACN
MLEDLVFEEYIGQLALASLASIEIDEDIQDREAWQKEREQKLSTILKDWLQLSLVGQEEEFTAWTSSEARSLSKAGLLLS